MLAADVAEPVSTPGAGPDAIDPLAAVRLNPALRGRDLLTDTDLAPGEILDVMHSAAVLKRLRRDGVPHAWLAGKTLGLIFQHPSTRTRTALQAAMEQLGGQAIFLGLHDLQLRRGETIRDTAEVFSRYVEGIAVRVEDRADLFELAAGARVPVLNGLTSFDHPIEALSDVFTLRERFGTLVGLRFAYLGDGNNVCHSLLLSCAAVGVSVTVAGPAAYGPDPEVVATARRLAEASGATVTITDDPAAAVDGADAVYTDVHESMGEAVNPGKLMALAPYRVTQGLMRHAKPEAVFMHCLPLHRGQEVDSEVADGPQSIIFDQAENRLHVHKAVLLQVLHDERLDHVGREGPVERWRRQTSGPATCRARQPLTMEGQMTAACPECGADVDVEGVEQGEIVPCPDCGADLEVLSANPVELGLAPEEGEDWGE